MIVKFLYNVFNNDLIVLGIIIVIIGSFWWIKSYENKKNAENERYSGNQYESCTSPNCVRCNKYDSVRKEANIKLQQYAQITGTNGLDRLHDALTVLPTNPPSHDDPAALDSGAPQPNVLNMPHISATPFWPNNHFLDIQQMIESNFQTILPDFQKVFAPLRHISRNGPSDPQSQIMSKGWLVNDTPTGCWAVFHLFNQGEKIIKNCNKVPATSKLVENIPGFMQGCVFGNASFSVLFPGTHITGHFGPCNVRIRCHLGV